MDIVFIEYFLRFIILYWNLYYMVRRLECNLIGFREVARLGGGLNGFYDSIPFICKF